MSSPLSSTKPHETRITESPSPVRLRSVLLVSIIASVLTLALGVTGGIGLWYRAQPLDGTTVHAQPSLKALAGQALTEARDILALVRHSAARDLSRVSGLLHRAEGGEVIADVEDMRAQNGTQTAKTARRTMEHSSNESWPEGLSRVEGPVLTTEIVPLTAVPSPIEPPLHLVFDGQDVEVTPPLMQHVRLRSVSRPLSQGTSDETGLVEVVVSASGTVESAKFVTSPLNVHESMLLSAVKAWRFRPALRHGQAIRYRLRVRIGRARI